MLHRQLKGVSTLVSTVRRCGSVVAVAGDGGWLILSSAERQVVSHNLALLRCRSLAITTRAATHRLFLRRFLQTQTFARVLWVHPARTT
jgi:hypothetical protein